jgi:branched-chain amino acid transport system permease protein
MEMSDIFQAILSGLALGGVYALVALGFNITYNTTKTFNFGQGEFLVVGAFIGLASISIISGKGYAGALTEEDVTPLIYFAGAIASVVVLAVLGVLLYFTAVRPFQNYSGLAWVMSTIGFGIIAQNVALAIWGPSSYAMPSPLGNGILRIGDVGVRPQEILVLVVTLCIIVGLDFFLRKTRLGKAVRAVSQNHNAATMMGINVSAIIILAFVISSCLAGLGGLLVAPITTVSVFMGLALALKAFSAAILGGLDNPRGCMLGGFIIGLLESLIGLWQAGLREITIFLLIILVLVIKPEGLLGRRYIEKV